MKTLQTNRGFTLIELLVVIAIIGMLASVVLASLNTARTKARDARRVSDLKQVQTALELYFDSQSPVTYPSSIATLASSTNAQLPSEPKDPKTGSSYGYYTANSTSYELGTTLEGTSITSPVTCTVGGSVTSAMNYCLKP